MTNELAVRASDVNVDDLYRVGKMLALSGYFDAKGNSDMAIAQVCTKVLAGREMGYGPFASVQGIHIIQGKPSISANLMAAAVKGSGRYDYRVRNMGDDAVSIEFFEVANGKRESLGVSSYTLKEAGAAGLTSNPTWKKFPRNMLFARALSNGVRWYCPDVFSGNAVYVPEELGASVDGDGNVIDVDYRSVDKATGEVLSTTTQDAHKQNSNGNGKPAQAPQSEPTPDLPAVVAEWQTPDDAFMWAIAQGAVDGGVPHAKNLLQKIAAEFGGLKKSNAAQVYKAFYYECLDRAADAEAEPLEAEDDDSVPAEVTQDAPEMAF